MEVNFLIFFIVKALILYKGCKTIPSECPVYKYSELLAVGHFENRLLYKSHQKWLTMENDQSPKSRGAQNYVTFLVKNWLN